MLTCASCGKRGEIADDETDPGWDEMACDTRGLVARSEYVCGECLERAEDGAPTEKLSRCKKESTMLTVVSYCNEPGLPVR